jgi:hypothetical protein
MTNRLVVAHADAAVMTVSGGNTLRASTELWTVTLIRHGAG